MSEQQTPNDQNSETGEFETGEFDRSGVHSQTGTHRRRRRRKSKKKKSNPIVLQLIGFLLFGAFMIGIGVIVGSSNNYDDIDYERNRISLENRHRVQQKWLADCEATGYSDWACDHFDHSHFEVAQQFDSFSCKNDETGNHRCNYVLGKASVTMIIPTVEKFDGRIRLSRRRARTVIEYSDSNNENYIGISSSGRIEIRKKNQTTPAFAINPATGILHALQTTTAARVEE